MLALLKAYYARAQKPLAFVLVALILLGEVIPNTALQLSAAIVLATLVLQVLFDIHDVIRERTTRWYQTFQEALPIIAQEVRHRLRSHRRSRIQWIGITLETAWPTAQDLLVEVLSGTRDRQLQVELAILDPDSISNRSVRKRGRATISSIEDFLDEHHSELDTRKCVVALYKYSHRPTWHGVLVDDDLLYYSPSFPSQFRLAHPQGGVEIVRASDGPESADRIRHFTAWFIEIKTSGPAIQSGATQM
jgi:hypothetical protein